MSRHYFMRLRADITVTLIEKLVEYEKSFIRCFADIES